ncbi:MAG: fibronectin type III domain-containing protein [Actinomycetia bacterium]|nr:fibronectin type III domain-containing protein [Actinomycetes bacterium]
MLKAPLRYAAAGIAAVALTAATMTGAHAAITGSKVSGLEAKPTPPKKVSVSWTPYTDFTVLKYMVSLDPGSRFQETTTTKATFDDLSWGVTYTASVVAIGTGGEESPTAKLVIPGAKLTANIDKESVARGTRLSLTGILTEGNGTPIADVPIKVQWDPAPGPTTYSDLAAPRTNGAGAYEYSFKASRNATFRVLYAGAGTAGSWAYEQTRVKTKISINASPNPARVGRQVVFTGQVKAPNKLVKGETIQLQRLSGTTWNTVRSSTVADNGGYRIVRKMKNKTDYKWRVYAPATSTFIGSPSRTVKVVVN